MRHVFITIHNKVTCLSHDWVYCLRPSFECTQKTNWMQSLFTNSKHFKATFRSSRIFQLWMKTSELSRTNSRGSICVESCDCHVTASGHHSDGMVSRDELVQYFLRANQQLRGYFKHAFVEHTFLPPVTCEKCGGLVRSG